MVEEISETHIDFGLFQIWVKAQKKAEFPGD